MADGYPGYERRGSKDVFKFRFPKFTRKVLYDPPMNVYSVDDGINGSTGLLASVVTMLVFAVSQLVRMFV